MKSLISFVIIGLLCSNAVTQKIVWKPKASLPNANSQGIAVTCSSKIYYIIYTDVQEYDPVTDSWTNKKVMITPRHHLRAAVVEEKIYIIGGTKMVNGSIIVATENEVYDPQTDTWETKAPIPVVKYNYSVGVFENKIYIFGGSTPDGESASTYVYDPVSDNWNQIPSMPTTRFNAGTTVVGDKIIISGGLVNSTPTDRVDIYDPSTGI